MKKKTTIRKINKIIVQYGGFNTGETHSDIGICLNQMGNLIALVEGLYLDRADVNVYNPSSFNSCSIESYTVQYNDMKLPVLKEILKLCKEYKQIQYEYTQSKNHH